MSVIESAVNWALSIANDNSHGYDQGNRWGPDYDCSSLVISAFKQAGVPLKSTYTGNMLSDFLSNGFSNVTSSVNLQTGGGLLRGDVLLNVASHTAMFIGNGKVVQACSNENKGILGGKTGDQTGGEICTGSYYNFPWNFVLRYTKESSSTITQTQSTSTSSQEIQNGSYKVKSGDSLWSIAERLLGAGIRYREIVELNGLKSNTVYVGQILKIPGKEVSSSEPVNNSKKCTVSLPVLSYGDNSMTVRKVQAILQTMGYIIAVDGDFGVATKSIIRQFQVSKNIPVTEKIDAKTWEALLG